MSSTSMLTGNALTVNLWSKEDWYQINQEAMLGHLMDSGAVYKVPEFNGKQKGDTVTFSYRGKGTGKALGEGQTLVGNEDSLDLESQSMVLGVQRYAVKNPNDEDTIESQRTHIEFEKSSREQIRNRYIEWLDAGCFYHLAGASPTTLTIDGTSYASEAELTRNIYGFNVPSAPTSDRVIRPNGVTTDQGLGSADTMTLRLVDYMLEKAGNSTQMIPYLAGKMYNLYVSHEQLVDLQHDTSSPVQWYTNALAAVQGGNEKALSDRFMNNMVSAGRYRNVNIYAHPRVAYGENGSSGAVITTVRRAVMVGKDALCFGSPFGGRVTDTEVPIKYKTELQDYDYYKGIEGRLIWSLKKNVPNNKQDYGVLVCSTYAATHA